MKLSQSLCQKHQAQFHLFPLEIQTANSYSKMPLGLELRWPKELLTSPEASAAMKNLEHAKSNVNGTKRVVAAPKRKTQTIRNIYHDMRKRLRRGYINSFDMVLQDEMCIEKNTKVNEIGGSGNVNCSSDKGEYNNFLADILVKKWNQLGSSHSTSEETKVVQAITDIILGLQGDIPRDMPNGVPFIAVKKMS
ncbi:unnamed protein product [Vicia faba]|uniref:Uncharacterized protein n=1 Tax=Vicia faba TaxID=3906 RepID=A0AAV0Z381_VICFA|nr:unnamed protein product [Vicia faba]